MTDSLPLLVFSDLDGTLLDHDTYEFAPALPALRALGRVGAGVVLATSKTAAEVAPIRSAMALDAWPAIVENGAGILEPGTGGTGDDGTYRKIRAKLRALPPGFEGFGDLTATGVAALTGLSLEAAQAAKARQFSEPGLWKGDPSRLDAFIQAALASDLHARQGGRFLTLSMGGTKADRMIEIAERYGNPATVALGDAPNDAEMIAAAHHGVIVCNPQAPPMPLLDGEKANRITRTTLPGPAGWAEAIFDILEMLGLSKEAASHG